MANLLIGITGSIAAYKAILLVRELSKQGHNCRVILTAGAQRFVTAEVIAGLGCEVYRDQHLDLTDPRMAMLHINLAKWAERFIIAPASAHTLAKLAHGFADNLLSEAVLAYGNGPIYLAPAMNQQMWSNSITQANLASLRQHGFSIWEPQTGLQACGDTGYGRMLEAEELVQLTLATLEPKVFSGLTLMITLGATAEAIDPVRVITNHSSGKMGLALIQRALALGAKVIAIHGQLNVSLPEHERLQCIAATSAVLMLEQSLYHAATASAMIGCAAVCDYRLATPPATHKIKKHSTSLSLDLVANPDIIATIKQQYPQLPVIGFAAETDNILAHAQHKLSAKNLDLIIANDVSNGQVFNREETEAYIVYKDGTHCLLPLMSKTASAGPILAAVLKQIQQQAPCR